MASPWSVEKELCGLARVRTPAKALWRLGVIGEPSPEVTITEVEDWTRAGAETYIYRFRVTLGPAVRDVLLKAVVGFRAAGSVSDVAKEWVARRRLLEAEGVPAPTLYCAKRALLMEQFIPHNLAEHLSATSPAPGRLADRVIEIAAALDRLGFSPLSPFHSLRTEGTEVFAVDFGQDLGPPAVRAGPDGRLLGEAVRWLARCGQRVDGDRAVALYARYLGGKTSEAGRWI
jgi:hypothetical protein